MILLASFITDFFLTLTMRHPKAIDIQIFQKFLYPPQELNFVASPKKSRAILHVPEYQIFEKSSK